MFVSTSIGFGILWLSAVLVLKIWEWFRSETDIHKPYIFENLRGFWDIWFLDEELS